MIISKYAVAGMTLALTLAMSAGAGAGAAAAAKDDPLLRPIAPAAAARWLGPQVPVHVHGETYLVGFAGLNVALIRTDAGLILIDGAVPQAVPAIEANIRRLGFRVRDVKIILSTEPHFDHAGGLAALVRDSGATVLASAPAAAELRTGHGSDGDPQAGQLENFPAVPRPRAVKDGERIRLGSTVITARATPGHTMGSMSWTWPSCVQGRCLDIVFASSLNPISAEGYRFTDPAHRPVVAAFRSTFALVRALPCDILITAHPDQSGGDLKVARLRRSPTPNPYIDPAACQTYADKYQALLDARLRQEQR